LVDDEATPAPPAAVPPEPASTAAGLGPVPPGATADPPLQGIRVLDMTIMWAGPLATWLLASLGAEVVKVEPACRPDGLRGSPGLFEACNRGKRRADLDLRRPEERDRFLDLVAGADLVIDNFSPRVAPNLGIEPAALRGVNPQVCSLSMPAFPLDSEERDWVAYGTGVHAISGLGDAGPDGFAPPAVTYPDALAGFAAFAVAVALLAHREPGPRRVPSGTPTNHAEVTLRGVVEPLRALHDLGATLCRPVPAAGLRRLGRTVLECGLPPSPFRGRGLPVDLGPAPRWDA
jgi:hypothetical protein